MRLKRPKPPSNPPDRWTKRTLANIMRTVNQRIVELAQRWVESTTGEGRSMAEEAFAEMRAAVTEDEDTLGRTADGQEN